MSTNGTVRLVVDHGSAVRLGAVARAAALPAIATAVCEQLTPLLGTQLTLVSARAIALENNMVGVVTLREEGPQGVRLHSGTAEGSSPSNAVAEAVLHAVHADEGLMSGAARRWASAPDVLGVTVVQNVDVTAVGEGDEVERHLGLIDAMPGPGRLVVDTEGAEDRVLRLEGSALAVTLKPGAALRSEVDGWMSLVDAACSRPPPLVRRPATAQPEPSTAEVPPLVVAVERALGAQVLGLRFLPGVFV